MRLHCVFVSQEHRYSLEREAETMRPIFAIPVRNQTVEYLEFYAISETEFGRFMADPEAARAFAHRCGRREMDDRLVLKPGSDRGEWA